MKNHLLIVLALLTINHIQAQVLDFKTVDFIQADNIAKLHKGHSLENLPVLVHKLTYKLTTPVEKLRAIYSWVCYNIKGDHILHTKVNKQRKKLKNDSIAFRAWNHQYKRTIFKKLLKYKKTMCTGYAYLIKEMCFLANIECVIINGYARSVDSNIHSLTLANHSWNAIKLNNKWYLCDATWSSGYMVANSIFVPEYNDGYFLTDPKLFGKNHFPLQKKWLLTTKIKISNFTSSPLVYGETFKHKIMPIYPPDLDTSVQKNDQIKFRFKTKKNIVNDAISLAYYSGNKERNLQLSNFENDKDTISFTHTFKRKGIYDVHLKIHEDIVATYTINVSKK